MHAAPAGVNRYADLADRNRTICDLWREGHSQQAIAFMVGLKQARISSIVRAYGLPANGLGRKRRTT
ncbi:MAG: hypothetical protein NUW22_12520 [Acidobacteria bacterium]|nr:hypothetical protein [Acidobacteriota bacterium]